MARHREAPGIHRFHGCIRVGRTDAVAFVVEDAPAPIHIAD